MATSKSIDTSKIISLIEGFVDMSKVPKESSKHDDDKMLDIFARKINILIQNLHKTLNEPDLLNVKIKINEGLKFEHCDSYSHADIIWYYILHGLYLLHMLKCELHKLTLEGTRNVDETHQVKTEHLKERQKRAHSKKITEAHVPPADILSIKEQKLIQTLTQVIVCLGICPYLQPGVGLPPHMRSGFSDILEEINHHIDSSKPQFHERRLYITTQILSSCLNQKSLKAILISRHLIDLVSALCQLGYSKLEMKDICIQSEQETKTSASQISSNDDLTNTFDYIHTLNQEGSLIAQERNDCAKLLHQILNHTYRPLVVQILFALQNSSSNSQQIKESRKGNAL